MEWLNYHHLLYFWTVAREGSLVKAGKVLRLSHPTLSSQIRSLENQMGKKLFRKAGRSLALTETGQVVYRYAEEIFTLGREMLDTVTGQNTGGALRLHVGAVDVVPKLLVRSLLAPALRLESPVRLLCHEGSYERLLADLAMHALHLVLSDAPVPPGSNVRVYSHLLGESEVSFFGTAALAKRFKKGFPHSLENAPMLLPLESVAMRRAINLWLSRHKLKPNVVAEFQDSALMKTFGADGMGIFPAPTVVAPKVVSQFGVQHLGRAPEAKARFYAVSAERQLTHPAVQAVLSTAREELFPQPKATRTTKRK